MGLGRVWSSSALRTAHGVSHGLSKVLDQHLQTVLLGNSPFSSHVSAKARRTWGNPWTPRYPLALQLGMKKHLLELASEDTRVLRGRGCTASPISQRLFRETSGLILVLAGGDFSCVMDPSMS